MAKRKAFLLRVSPELMEALRRLAAQEMRSMNGQIEYMLRAEVRKRGLLGKDEEGDATRDQDRVA